VTYSPDPSAPPGITVDQARRSGQGRSFGTAADLYERGRPTYPREAADWLIPSDATTVVDLGAGTGKFTRQLVAPGRDVSAVDPDAAMLEVLHSVLPDVATFVGTAESLPFADNSVDAITVAQAWHWVDLDKGVPEVARVLRPGGTLGLIWNVRNETEPWVGALSGIIHQGGSQDLQEQDPVVGPPFEPVEAMKFPWVNVITIDEFTDMVASRSYMIAMPADDRARVLNEVRELLLTERGFDPDHIELPYVTHAYRTHLPN
jgi:SAM-dependent methyltransferase